MKRLPALLLLLFSLGVISFGTWQLFHGNLEAAFSVLPFLLINFATLMVITYVPAISMALLQLGR